MTIEQTVEIPATPTNSTRNIERVDEQMPHGVGPLNVVVTVNATGRRRLTIDVPPGVPTGRVVLTFTPEGETRTGGSRDTPEYLRRKAMEWQDAEFFMLHAEELNREAEDVLKYQGDIFDLIPPYET